MHLLLLVNFLKEFLKVLKVFQIMSKTLKGPKLSINTNEKEFMINQTCIQVE